MYKVPREDSQVEGLSELQMENEQTNQLTNQSKHLQQLRPEGTAGGGVSPDILPRTG